MELIVSTPSVHANASRDPGRSTTAAQAAPALTDESLVADARADLTPAQMVEHKLASLLKRQSLPLSQMMTAGRTSRSR
jgi:hypothetical protein